MILHYKLDANWKPIPEPDLLTWARWFETADRQVARDRIDDADVSTIFLGINHDFTGHGPPVLWETMVFGGALNGAQDRCAGSREQAEAMHADMMAAVHAQFISKHGDGPDPETPET